MNSELKVDIVLVEDDPGHARLIQKNLKRANIRNTIIHLSDGQEALDFFFNPTETEKPGRAILVLLDLNLPKVSGYEVLSKLKASETTKNIPVVMLTTTSDDTEIKKCYESGCNVFVTKPVDYENFAKAIERLGLFLSVVQIPSVRG